MNLTPHDIDRIVAEVVRRLLKASGKRQLPDSPGPVVPVSNQLSTNERLITLETLKHKQITSGQLTVSATTVITPAARDELKKRKIKLVVASVATKANLQTNSERLRLLATNFHSDVSTDVLGRLIAGMGGTLENRAASEMAPTLEKQCAAIIGKQSLAVWFTGEPARVLCQANRHEGIWAVEGRDETSLAQALGSVPANALVIDPRAKSSYTLQRMLRLFVR